MSLLNKFLGLAVVGATLTSGAAIAAEDTNPVLTASKALAAACADECYLNLTGRDGSLRTVLVRNGAGIGATFSFEILSRGNTGDWEGAQVNHEQNGVSHVIGWKDHARVESSLAGGRADYRAELAKARASVRRDQVAANAQQQQLQRTVLKYLVALGYVGM